MFGLDSFSFIFFVVDVCVKFPSVIYVQMQKEFIFSPNINQKETKLIFFFFLTKYFITKSVDCSKAWKINAESGGFDVAMTTG